MMQFAARGALQVSAAENIEILVYLAKHNKVFGDLARMTLAGWDEKSSTVVAGDPQTPKEVLNYFISGDNLRPALLPKLLDNPSVPEADIARLATSAMRDTIDVMLKSERVRASRKIVDVLKSNPYVKKEEAAALLKGLATAPPAPPPVAAAPAAPARSQVPAPANIAEPTAPAIAAGDASLPAGDEEDEAALATYMSENASEIAAEGEKPFQSIGGVVELLGEQYFPVTQSADIPATEAEAAKAPARPVAPKKGAVEGVRMNALQKINSLDVKGRIQLALKGNKEERSLLIRDGTKVVALAVLEAPKLSDGEVEKFASQKNVLEAVLRQIPLKRKFMKNYIVVRNLVANPRTPLDLGLSLMKNLLPGDLKNISGNKDVSETIRKLALKMYKQKMESANKK